MGCPERFVVFDAVGTLIEPWPSAAEVYCDVAASFGSQLSQDLIERRLAQELRADAAPDQSSRGTDAGGERQRWLRIVGRVLTDVADVQTTVFPVLWDHFASPLNWRVYVDVPAGWRELRRAGLKLAIASNFDERLLAVCNGCPPLDEADAIFHSAGLGARKPAPWFFQQIVRQLDVDPAGLTMVGDDWQSDYQGARQAGWRAVWLDRSGRAGQAAEHRVAQLGQLAAVLAGMG